MTQINTAIASLARAHAHEKHIGARFLVRAAAIESQQGIHSATEITQALEELCSCEVSEGGPYAHTSTKGKNDVDVGSNLCIALYLALLGVRLPQLDAFIDSVTKGKEAASRFFKKSELLRLMAEYRRATACVNVAVPIARKKRALTGEQRRVAHMMQLVRKAARARFKTLPADVARDAMCAIERTIEGNSDGQMSLMAYYVREALGKKGRRFSDDEVAHMGLANVFFWTAFIIYDDFWDEDESADPRTLPIANLFARHYSDVFTRILPEKTGFRMFFHATMDALDAANAWETKVCRTRVDGSHLVVPRVLPSHGDFTQKYRPASGHILGPVAMLVKLGYDVRSKEVSHLISYFRHYLIAMQLNDDAHDWKEDMARGHLSTVVVPLLKQWKKMHPDRSTIDLVKDQSELEQLFWFEVIAPVCTLVLFHAGESRKSLKSLTSLENTNPLERFIYRNELIAEEALRQQKADCALVQAFGMRFKNLK